MVIEKETMETDMDIDIKMLENNHIEPLLPVKIRHIDNRSLYYYDVTSRQQFSKIYEYRKLSRKNVDNILKSLNEMVDAVNEYMLNLNCIILKTVGSVKEYQKVIAVCSMVRDIKVGDLVAINPSKYIKKKDNIYVY